MTRGVAVSWIGLGLFLSACGEPVNPGGNADAANGSEDGGALTTPSPGADASTDGGMAADAQASTTEAGSPPLMGTDGSFPAADTGCTCPADAGSPPPADAATPGSPPTIGGCSIFPADNPWNTRIDDPQKFPVHAQSAAYLASIGLTTTLHPDWGDWSTNHYGIPWQTVPTTQPKVPMTFTYATESDPGPYPFPPTVRVEGGSGSGGDMHVLVLDTGTCTLYETWSSTYSNPGWSCGSGAKFNLGSNALRPDGWTSADAAGLSVFAGLVKVSEVMAGAIHHALRFSVARSQQAYIHPATHAAGTANANLPPMGLRLRLKASFSLSPFSGPEKVILTAMKEYGLILADNGSNWYVTGDSDDAWGPLMGGIIAAFRQVQGGNFEAVDSGPLH
jgi:hypothetical protein